MKKNVLIFMMSAITLNLIAQNVTVPYHESFENAQNAANWTTYDLNSDDGNWFWADAATYGGIGYQQSSCFAYIYSYQNAADDWAVSPGIAMSSGMTYNISFKVAQFDETKTDKLKVFIGSSSLPDDFTEEIADFDSLTSTTFQAFNYSFTPASDGNFYVGLYAYSNADQGAILIDEFDVSIATAVKNEIGIAENIVIYPNPAKTSISLENAAGYNVSLLDITGKTVYSSYRNEDQSNVTIENYPNGIYLLKMEKAGNVKFLKLRIER